MDETLGASVSTDLMERVDARREEGESRSACTRRLVRQALDDDRAAQRRPVLLAGAVAGAAMLALRALVEPAAAPVAAVGAAHVALTTLWAVWPQATDLIKERGLA
jgi:hypothetical protein